MGRKKYLTSLLRKYRFVIMTDNSLEEKFVVRASKLNLFSFIFLFLFFGSICALLLIAYTPINQYVPGRSTKDVQKNLLLVSFRSDSLEKVISRQTLYLKNLQNIVSGEVGRLEAVDTTTTTTNESKESRVSFEKSQEDSLFRVLVEAENSGSIYVSQKPKNSLLVFFPPVFGVIIDGFDKKTKHFGIDIVSKEKTRISSVLDGSVVISHWTAETGYVIAIQHKNDYLSVYKHNATLLKKTGDFVVAGEHVAIMGNSGELSSGPHLHFELWHKGSPVDPENYISF